MKAANGISDDWLVEFVVPNIFAQYHHDIALTLARPLLWAVFEPNFNAYLPVELCNHIQQACKNIPGQKLQARENPVEKVLIVVNGYEGEVYIDELGADGEQGVEEGDGNNQNVGNAVGGNFQQQGQPAGYQKNESLGFYSQVNAL